MRKNIIIIFTIYFLLSCNSDDRSQQQFCTEEYVYGLKVTVKNSVTNIIITEGITIMASDGSYEEELMQIEGSDYFLGAGEREGTYVIEITSDDYQSFASNPIIVEKTEDDCHVITEDVEFFLQPN